MRIQTIEKYILLGLLLSIGPSTLAQNNRSYLSAPKKVSDLQFIEDIQLTPTNRATHTIPGASSNIVPSTDTQSLVSFNKNDIESLSPFQFKYAQLLNIEVELTQPASLYRFIDQWWETPYQYGGSTLSGIDCSAFSAKLQAELYQYHLPRTAKEQYSMCAMIDSANAKQGDLVFFSTTRKSISHVGVYLANGYFVHASTSLGVTISHLSETYYQKRFRGFGRFNPTAEKPLTVEEITSE
jgi:lipoprotein Spr